MDTKHLLDPDDPTTAREVEDGLLESLGPVHFPPKRAEAVKLRLFDRIRASREAGKDFIRIRFDEGEWESLVPGVRVKRMQGDQRAALLELQPGAAIPFHRHHEDEECLVLRGRVELGEISVGPGDYHLAPSGSRHGIVRSAGGALIYLRGTPIGHPLALARDMITALLPGEDVVPMTIPRDEGPWAHHAPGVDLKLLREEGGRRSMLLRLEPGARADLAFGAADDCLQLEGEVSVDEVLLQAGDFGRPAGAGSQRRVTSATGGLMFMNCGG